MTAPSLTIDTGRCAHETVAGETMVIDTLTGELLVLTGSGPAVWAALLAGATRAALVAEVAARYDEAAGAAVGAFVDELVAAGAVVEGPGADPTAVPDWPAAATPPGLERFDEIADIMAVDPVHEVDEAQGWPHRSAG